MIIPVIQGLLAAMYAMAGVMKFMKPKEKLAQKMGWVNDFSAGQLKTIATVEVLAAVGLALGLFVSGLAVLAKLGAAALVILMAGAAYTHMRRKETGMMAMTVVLLLVAVWLVFSI